MPHTERSAADGAAYDPRNAGDPRSQVHSERFEEEIDLGRYLRPLARYWTLLVAGGIVGAIIGFSVSLRRPTVYEASTTVLAQQAGSVAALATSRALLQNFTLAAETIKETGLDQAPYRISPQAFVERVLSVEDVPGTMLLRVKTRLADPGLAARASQVLSDKAVELNRRVAVEGNTSVRSQLKVLLDDAAGRLQGAEQQLVQQRSQRQLELLKKDTEVMLEGRGELAKLIVAIESERARLTAAEKELEKHQPVLSVPRAARAEEPLRRVDREAAGNPTRPPTAGPGRTRENEPGGRDRPQAPGRTGQAPPDELLDLSNPFVNPVYQTLVYQIATSRAQLAAMERERREIAGVRHLDAARFRQLSELYSGEIEIARLENEYDLARKVFSDLSVRYEQSRAESVGSMVQLQIVDRAVPPERPLPRRRVESTVLGFVAGVAVAGMLALALSREHERGEAVAPRAS